MDTWIFTFGSSREIHGDRAGKYVRIKGTFESAREEMFKRYGSKWAFQYSEEEWEEIKRDPNRFWEMETELEE